MQRIPTRRRSPWPAALWALVLVLGAAALAVLL